MILIDWNGLYIDLSRVGGGEYCVGCGNSWRVRVSRLVLSAGVFTFLFYSFWGLQEAILI